MSVLLLVRHGQASFGSDDYDQLSPFGESQSARLGAALAARGVVPTRVVTGAMKRHDQTARETMAAARWAGEVVVDHGWDEFDHQHVLAVHAAPESDEAVTEARAFQRWFEKATLRWSSGEHDEEYDESFPAFRARVEDGLRRTAEGLVSGETAVVFTSGGPVAWTAASLLGGGAAQWMTLNRVTVNSGVTKIVVGRNGLSMVSFNDHSHLEPAHVTYR